MIDGMLDFCLLNNTSPMMAQLYFLSKAAMYLGYHGILGLLSVTIGWLI